MMLNERLDFSVPITESVTKNNQDFLIKGIAINAGKTRNDTIFVNEELQSSASSLIGKPLLKDHDNVIDSIVGKVTNAKFNQNKIEFEAQVIDEMTKQKISQGLINSVSVGAMVSKVETITEEVDGEESFVGHKVMGIDFVELSLVAVPADPNAGFAQAVCEKLKSSNPPLKETSVVGGNSTFITTNNNAQNSLLLGEDANKMAEEKTKLETLREEMVAVEEELATMKLDKLKAEKVMLEEEAEAEPEAEATPEVEAPAEEEAKEEEAPVEDKTEGEVADEPAEEVAEESYEVQTGQDTIGVGVSQSYNTNESLTRLRREI